MGTDRTPELEDDALHALDSVAAERVATPLENHRSHTADVQQTRTTERRALVAVTLEQNDLLAELERFRQGHHTVWPTVDELVAVTGYSRRAVRRMVAALTRVGLVAIGVRGEAIVVGEPGGVFYPTTKVTS